MTEGDRLICIEVVAHEEQASAAEALLEQQGVQVFVLGSGDGGIHLFVPVSEAQEVRRLLARRPKEATSA